MANCPKCPQSETKINEQLYLVNNGIIHCSVCGKCMLEYSVAPKYFPKPIYRYGIVRYFCSDKCLHSANLYRDH